MAPPIVDAVTYFHNDIAGTPLLATNASGAVVWKENYLPYGQRQAQTPASAGNKLWYTGKPHEEDTGLTYMGARYYMPLVGRFAGIDPVDIVPGQPHSLNRYAYGNNNPYKYIDPNGKYAESVWDAFNIALGFNSLVDNIRAGNWSGAALDGVGLALDSAATAMPVVPGGAAAGIRAYRAGEAAKGVATEAKLAKEGIYEFREGARMYCGQSCNIPGRLQQHIDSGKLTADALSTVKTTEVLGGKTAREIAEHRRIQEITGGVPARFSDRVSNKVDPIGPNRSHLLD